MNKKETVYIPTKIEDELPKEKGYYSVCSINLTTKNESIDNLRFNGIKFIDMPNWEHIYWLKPTKEYSFTEEELKQLLFDYTDRIVENAQTQCDEGGETGFVNKESITEQLSKYLKELNL
jgi:hypothetical protein